NVAATMTWVFDLSPTISRLTTPVLILHRKRSQVADPAQVRLAASLIPGARLVTLDGDANVPYVDHEQFLDTLLNFLDPVKETQPANAASGVTTVLFTDLVGHT